MKNKMTVIALAMLLVFALYIPSITAYAEPDETGMTMHYVIDAYGLLSFDEWTDLENRAASISGRYDCGIYIVTVDDYRNYGDGSVYNVTRQIYFSDSDFGVGDDRDGILLLLSMNERDYALYVYGEKAERIFSDSVLIKLENAFLGYLGNNNWSAGFSVYIRECADYLAHAQEGGAMGNTFDGRRILIVVVSSCAVALVVCLIIKGGMKSVRQKNEARAYVVDGGLHLTQHVDMFTHTTRTSRKIESSSGSSGRGRVGGGHGRSGKF